MQERLKVGNVIFAEEGVMVVRPYITDEVRITDNVITYDMIRPYLLALCVRRIRHCAKMLEMNLANATQVHSEFVVWDGGHFSLPVYKALQQFVGSNGVKGEFTPLIAQQCLREIYRAGNVYRSDFQDEKFYEDLRNTKVGTEGVFMALTESLLCAIDNESWVKMHE